MHRAERNVYVVYTLDSTFSKHPKNLSKFHSLLALIMMPCAQALTMYESLTNTLTIMHQQ